MTLRTRMESRNWLWLSPVVLAFAIMACQPDSLVRPGASGEYFYPYLGQKIWLTLDRTRMVVGGESPVEDARSALASLGIEVVDAGPLPGGLRHLQLINHQNEAVLVEAEKRLRESGRLHFVVPGFRGEGGTSPILFLDRIDVMFRQGVTPQQVNVLATGMKLRYLQVPHPDSGVSLYRFQYPAGVGIGLLAIAAELDQHSLVEWASPDMVSGMTVSVVPPGGH